MYRSTFSVGSAIFAACSMGSRADGRRAQLTQSEPQNDELFSNPESRRGIGNRHPGHPKDGHRASKKGGQQGRYRPFVRQISDDLDSERIERVRRMVNIAGSTCTALQSPEHLERLEGQGVEHVELRNKSVSVNRSGDFQFREKQGGHRETSCLEARSSGRNSIAGCALDSLHRTSSHISLRRKACLGSTNCYGDKYVSPVSTIERASHFLDYRGTV